MIAKKKKTILKEIEDNIEKPKERKIFLEHIFNFRKKPAKAASMVNITSLMMANIFFILAIVWSISPDKFSPIIIGQLILAIPMLYVAGLSYSKVGYLEDNLLWDGLAWITNNLGNIFIFNVIGLMTAQFYKGIAISYFITLLALMGIYSYINIFYKHVSEESRRKIIVEKLFKYLFFALGIILLGILPLFWF